MVFAPKTARVAYTDPLWSWGGSPIRDTATPPRYHLFSSRMSANCGILHYCMNSEVIHLTSPNATGPFSYVETALAPRGDNWDNGAVPTTPNCSCPVSFPIHRLILRRAGTRHLSAQTT